jgi:hypothetical protein
VLAATVANNIKMNDTAEAYGWINTGQLMGYSAGAAMAGIAIDVVAPTAAMSVSMVFGIAAVIVALITVSITPVFGKTKADK